MTKLADIKRWSLEIEKEITNRWRKAELFKFNEKTKKKIYSIDTPPPYINAPIHMGHAVTYCYQDFFARYKRMKGFEVLFPLGLDRNGLPIEMGAEKKFKISAFQVGREKFIEYCEKLLKETSVESIDSFAKLGISFTSYKQGEHIGAVYLTDSPEYRALTQSTLIELYKRGLVYEDSRINNWDPKLQTTISDSEIEYKDIPSTFNDIKWKIKGSKETITIGTTRPELICTCGMVIYHPDDKRYAHLNGKIAVSPIFGKEVTIKPHTLANPEKGTGIVMMCSAGDLSDIQFFREQSIKPVIAINKDGRMNENSGVLKGLKVKEAREKIVELLKEEKLLIKQQQITHRTPISERSGVEVEFIEMPEFYLKQMEFKEEIRKISRKIRFYPETARKILEDWIDSIAIDWPISRRRFYATPIPFWRCDLENLFAVPKPGKYYIPWKEKIPADAEVYKNGKKIGNVADFKDKKWVGEERVFDTWIDSSISELFITKYKSNEGFFKKAYPISLRPQGKEIVRTWLYYTILRGYFETKKPCFEDVWIHQHILDAEGRKMAKSVGNVIDPQEIIKEYGAEALRLWGAVEGNLARQDLKCSKEKIQSEVKTLTKLLNVAKFIMQFKKPSKKLKLMKTDKLFIDYMESLTKRADESYSEYDFHKPLTELKTFLWDGFASHYIELVKNRAYNQENRFSEEGSESARYALHYLLERLLVLAYPVIPQITSFIAHEKGIDLLNADFPEASKLSEDISLIPKIFEFNSRIWKMKREKNISLRNAISGIEIPEELTDFKQDLIACHNLE